MQHVTSVIKNVMKTTAPMAKETAGLRPLRLPLARRKFLKGSGVLLGSLASGSLLAQLAPSTTWALELKILSRAEGEALMAMGRVLYPHEKLPDAVYALLAKDLDHQAHQQTDTAQLLRTGVAWLNQSATRNFTNSSVVRKIEIVRSMEGTAFFKAVRSQCVTSIYDNDMAYAAFGYPGSSWEKAGYLHRGFQDLKWLAEPDAQASPAPDAD